MKPSRILTVFMILFITILLLPLEIGFIVMYFLVALYLLIVPLLFLIGWVVDGEEVCKDIIFTFETDLPLIIKVTQPIAFIIYAIVKFVVWLDKDYDKDEN